MGREPLEYEKRVLCFDPSEIYNRVEINRYKRTQSIPMSKLFPQKDKTLCACGCGNKLEDKKRRWASEDCINFAQSVWAILTVRSETISNFLRLKFKHWACCKCGEMDKYKVYKNGTCVDAIEKEHIIAVKNGGGGCWLDNYQLLCDVCHKEKTKIDKNKAFLKHLNQ